MTDTGALARDELAKAMDKYAGQGDISYDLYWKHVPAGVGTQPCLVIVLVARNPLIGQPPIIGDHLVLNPLDPGPEIDQIVKVSVPELRAFQRKLLAGSQ